MSTPPSGTVTFLFTDIEGSTRLWQQQPDAMRAAVARHDALLRRAIEAHNGFIVKTTGDGVLAAFATAPAALDACLAAQRALLAEPWEPTPIRVRMGVHTGTAEQRDGDYFGPALNRAARLMAAGHGGQVLLSLAAQELVRDQLPPQVALRDLGERRLKDLIRPERVFQVLAPDLPQDFPPLKTLDARPNNLPVQLTSFVGREREMQAIKAALAKTRLLTLTGSGGAGKTRLALQVAADRVDDFAHGVWLVELAALSDARLVPQAVATVLDVQEEARRPLVETLAAYLKERELLIVLDNCEHLVEACARLADTLLRAAPGLKIVATSREGLNVAGETVYRVPSLTVPDPRHLPLLGALTQYEAVRLFIERAVAARADFAVTNANAPAVAEICHRLDGIPLAIELAAARVKVFAAEEIARRLADRFRLLTGGSRTALRRQQTLRALIEWGYDLLTEGERALLRRLSVFAGGWTYEAAEAVCGGGGLAVDAVLDDLSQLVNKSLIVADEQAPDLDRGQAGATRYRMLETIREYARERLSQSGEQGSAHKQHLDYYLQLAEEAAPELTGREQIVWLQRVEREHENFRAALGWALEQAEVESGLRLCVAVARFWDVRGHASEGRQWLAQALAAGRARLTPSAPADERARYGGALNWASEFAWKQGDYGAARALAEEGLTLFRAVGDTRGMAGSLNNLGIVAWYQGDYGTARALYAEGLALRRALGDQRGMATSFHSLGLVAWNQGDYAEARALYLESLALRRALGDKRGMANSLNNLGLVAANQGDYAEARALYTESLTLSRELGDKRGIATSLHNLGIAARNQGDYAEARALYVESLALRRELGNKQGMASLLNSLGIVAWNQGDYAEARALYAESLALQRELGDKRGMANSLNNLGLVAANQDDYAEARALYTESLTLRRELGNTWGMAETLVGWAGLALARQQPQRAATLSGAVAALLAVTHLPLDGFERTMHDNTIAALRAQLDEATFNAAWEAGRALTLEQAIEYALNE